MPWVASPSSRGPLAYRLSDANAHAVFDISVVVRSSTMLCAMPALTSSRVTSQHTRAAYAHAELETSVGSKLKQQSAACMCTGPALCMY